MRYSATPRWFYCGSIRHRLLKDIPSRPDLGQGRLGTCPGVPTKKKGPHHMELRYLPPPRPPPRKKCVWQLTSPLNIFCPRAPTVLNPALHPLAVRNVSAQKCAHKTGNTSSMFPCPLAVWPILIIYFVATFRLRFFIGRNISLQSYAIKLFVFRNMHFFYGLECFRLVRPHRNDLVESTTM